MVSFIDLQLRVHHRTSASQRITWTHLVNTIKSVRSLTMRHSSRLFASRFICRKISCTWSALARKRSSQRWWRRSVRISIWHRTNTSSGIRRTCLRSMTWRRQSEKLAWTSWSLFWRLRVDSTQISTVSTPTTCWNTRPIRCRRLKLAGITAKTRCRKRRRTVPQLRWIPSTRPEWIWRPKRSRQLLLLEKNERRHDLRARTQFLSKKSSAQRSTYSRSRTQFFRARTFTCHRRSCSTQKATRITTTLSQKVGWMP